MGTRLQFDILPQPTLTTCGPTCLHAVYRYYGDDISLEDVIAQTGTIPQGGTLAVFLGCHALERGYKATIYTYNLEVWDPTWMDLPADRLADKLRRQSRFKKKERLQKATEGYLRFLAGGGRVLFEELSPALVRKHLTRGEPILTGLSATYLYRSARELPNSEYDDLAGDPTGHFVVLNGYDRETKEVFVADPWKRNPLEGGHYYGVSISHAINSILLGILTYDANLLVIEPAAGKAKNP